MTHLELHSDVICSFEQVFKLVLLVSPNVLLHTLTLRCWPRVFFGRLNQGVKVNTLVVNGSSVELSELTALVSYLQVKHLEMDNVSITVDKVPTISADDAPEITMSACDVIIAKVISYIAYHIR